METLILKAMRMIVRLEFEVPMSAETALLKPLFDATLCSSLVQARRAQISDGTWLDAHYSIAHFVVDKDLVRRCLTTDALGRHP